MTKVGAVAKLTSTRRIDEHIIGMELVAAIEGMVDLEQERHDRDISHISLRRLTVIVQVRSH